MTLDVSKPSDQVLVSEIPSYIRENRVSINTIDLGDPDVSHTALELSIGTTNIVVGTDLDETSIEVIELTATGACTISTIESGTQGQVKIIHFQDNNVSLVDGSKANGNLYLNQLPVSSTFNAQQDDIIAIVNIDGDGGSTNGYWKELWRQVSVK